MFCFSFTNLGEIKEAAKPPEPFFPLDLQLSF
jgi:hypothetical protein